MEENNQEENKDVPIEDETIPIEQVEKVIADSGNKESTGEYQDLTEDESKEEEKFQEELENPTETTETEGPEIKTTQQPKTPLIPTSKEDNRMKFLQFECQNQPCGGFKMYVNLEDDQEKELPLKLKCINCGKKKSIKRRILDITLNGYQDYVEPESPDTPTLPEED